MFRSSYSLLPLMFALASCNLSLSLNGKHSCSSDDDCVAGRICEEGLCVHAADGSPTPGADAGDDDEPSDLDGATSSDGDAGPNAGDGRDAEESQNDDSSAMDASGVYGGSGQDSNVGDGGPQSDSTVTQGEGGSGMPGTDDGGPCAFPAEGSTVTNPVQLACLCGAPSTGDSHVILDTGSTASSAAALI